MDGLKLINPEFDFEFLGEIYKVKKATLDKIILFQNRFAELTTSKDAAIEKKMAAYCIFLALQSATPAKEGLTEEWVQENCPDVEMTDVLEFFGFMNRQKTDRLREILQKGLNQNVPVQATGE